MSTYKFGTIFVVLAALLSAIPAAGQVAMTPGPDKIEVAINGKPFTTFYVKGEGVEKPYLWPVRAATGTYVTRGFPMADLPEEKDEPKDHVHQRGVFFAHAGVNGLDYWNNEASYTEPPRRGRMVLKSVDSSGGAEKGAIRAVFDWTDREGNVQLTETRLMTFYVQQDLRTIDFDITLQSVKDVVWGDAKDGAFAIRLRPALDEANQRSGVITNADGLVSERQAWGKASDWADYSGAVGAEKVGVAIFPHPDNPRHPSRWHLRGYGLFSANPFGSQSLVGRGERAGTPNGDQTVKTGNSLRFRYRLVVHPGDVKSADVAGMYSKYVASK